MAQKKEDPIANAIHVQPTSQEVLPAVTPEMRSEETLMITETKTGRTQVVEKINADGTLSMLPAEDKLIPLFLTNSTAHCRDNMAFCQALSQRYRYPSEYIIMRLPKGEVAQTAIAAEAHYLAYTTMQYPPVFETKHRIFATDLMKYQIRRDQVPLDQILAVCDMGNDVKDPEVIERMMMGLPTLKSYPAQATLPNGKSVTIGITPYVYVDHKDKIQVEFQEKLDRPEYLDQRFYKQFTPDDRKQLSQYGVLGRLTMIFHAPYNSVELCYVGINPETNRLVTKPAREVPEPPFYYRYRSEDRHALESGGIALLTNQPLRDDPNNSWSGKLFYDPMIGTYQVAERKNQHPYIPKRLRDQLSAQDLQTLISGGQIDGSPYKKVNGTSYSAPIHMDLTTNTLKYYARNDRVQQQTVSAPVSVQENTPTVAPAPTLAPWDAYVPEDGYTAQNRHI